MAEPLSDEEKAALAAAQARAEKLWGEHAKAQRRRRDGTELCFVGINDSDWGFDTIAEGRTWEDAFAAAELRCAPGLVAQLADALRSVREVKQQLEQSKADAKHQAKECGRGMARAAEAEMVEKRLRVAADAVVFAGLDDGHHLVPSEDLREKLYRLQRTLANTEGSPAGLQQIREGAQSVVAAGRSMTVAEATARALQLWGESGDAYADEGGPPGGEYVVGLRRPGAIFHRLGRGESWEKAFDAAEVWSAPGLYLRLVDATAVNNGLRTEVRELKDALHRDKTGLAAALAAIRAEVNGRAWVAEGRGPYEWDDDRYRAEAGDALRTVAAMAKAALEASGDLARMTLNRGPARVSEEGRELAAVLDRVREAGAWLAAAGFDDSPPGCGPVHRMLARLKTALRMLSSYENEKHRSATPDRTPSWRSSVPDVDAKATNEAAARLAVTLGKGPATLGGIAGMNIEAVSEDELAALAAAERRMHHRFSLHGGVMRATGGGLYSVFLRPVQETYNTLLAQGRSWDEAFEKLERHCAPGLFARMGGYAGRLQLAWEQVTEARRIYDASGLGIPGLRAAIESASAVLTGKP